MPHFGQSMWITLLPMTVLATVVALGAIATTAQLRAAGHSRHAIAVTVWRGDILAIRRGLHVLPALSGTVRAALAHGGPLCCSSAARSYGLWVLDAGTRPHVWLGRNGRAHRHVDCRCVVHRDGGPPCGGWRVPIVSCLLQIRRCWGEDAFFAALESALAQRVLSSAERAELQRRLPAAHRWLVDFARSDAGSGLESLLRLRLHRLGLALSTQVEVPGVGRVDFVIGDCLILETDGETHAGDNRHLDLVRDAMVANLGYVSLRFDYAMVVHDWELVETAILSALRRRLHITAGV